VTADACPDHGFWSLNVMAVNDDGFGSDKRLLGPKSCCARRGERKRWLVRSAELREMAAALIAEADEADRRATPEVSRGERPKTGGQP
jgi:hypothetical protein